MDEVLKVGESIEVKMTFGLLNECSRIVGGVDGLALMIEDAAMRENMLKAVLSKRDARGKITEEPNLFNLSGDEAAEVLDWAGAHVADFFLKQAGNLKNLMEARGDQLKKLTPT